MTEASHGYVARMAGRGTDRRAFVAVTYTGIALLASSNLPTPLYPTYQRAFELSPLGLTLVYSTYAGSVIVSLMLFGRLSDAVGRRLVLLPAVLLAVGAAGAVR